MRRRFMNNSNNIPLSFEALEDGLSISFSNEILYCINGGTWETLLVGENTEEINKGSVVSFLHAKSILGSSGVGTFSINKKCNVYGTCSSIIPKILGEKYMTDWLFSNLFYECDAIVDASKLELPATTLAYSCYYGMFYGCTSLTTAPALSATTLATYCYDSMFYGCTSLTTAPALPATTLAQGCYYGMFWSCTSLTTAPELPATTLANNCYYYMFSGCSKLNYIKMLATDISATNCLFYWVSGVASTGTFVKNSNMTSLPTGASGIPSGWTVVNDGGGVNLITFTIDRTEYQAEEGMTWEEWINSEYNKNSIYKINTINGFIYHSGYGPNTRIRLIDGSITYDIFLSDAILSNGTYILQASGGSGGS